MDDEKLINAIAKGDKQAFGYLYNKYATVIYNTSLSYCKNVEDAEEITQDVFVKIHKNISSFKGEASLNTWIYRITINTALTYVKRKNKVLQAIRSNKDSPSIDFEHPGVLMEEKENAATLYRVIDCLLDTQKTAFVLSYIENLPRQEVADIMNTTLKAVESLLQRAKNNLRSELEKYYPNRRKSKL